MPFICSKIWDKFQISMIKISGYTICVRGQINKYFYTRVCIGVYCLKEQNKQLTAQNKELDKGLRSHTACLDLQNNSLKSLSTRHARYGRGRPPPAADTAAAEDHAGDTSAARSPACTAAADEDGRDLEHEWASRQALV